MSSPASSDRAGRVTRAAAYLLVLLLSVLTAIWGAFLVPVRVAGHPVPIGLLLAAAIVPICRTGARLAETRAGAAGPWLGWVATALVLATRRREGDLVILGGARGLAFLAIGFLGGALAVGLGGAAPRPDQPAGPMIQDHRNVRGSTRS